MQLAWRTRLAAPVEPDDESATIPRNGTIPGELAIVEDAKVDPLAFAPLYEHYAPIVYHYCLRRLSHTEAAADATAIVFTKAIAALPKFTPDPRREGSTFRSWLFAIAHNLVIDAHRTRCETASLDDVAGHHALRDPARSPEEQAIASEQRRALVAAISTLTDGQRQVVELRLAGLTGPEIAATLNLHLSAVKSAQFRAYTRLRDLLGDALEFDHPTTPAGETDHA